MKSDREIKILFRRLRLYDQLERRAEGLVRTIQRVMEERYGPRASVPKSSTCASKSEDSVRRSSSFSAPAYRLWRPGFLQRMQAKIEGLCDERDRLKKEESGLPKDAYLTAGMSARAPSIKCRAEKNSARPALPRCKGRRRSQDR